MLGLCCYSWAFSSYGKWGLLSPCFLRASHYGDFSCCGPWVLGYSGFSSCGARAQLTHGMWDLPRPGIKWVSLAFQGRFLNYWTDGEALIFYFLNFRLMSLVFKALLNHLPFLLVGKYSKKIDQSYNPINFIIRLVYLIIIGL